MLRHLKIIGESYKAKLFCIEIRKHKTNSIRIFDQILAMSSSTPDLSTPGSSGISSRGRSWSHFQFPSPEEGPVSSMDTTSQGALDNTEIRVDQQAIGDLFATLTTQPFNCPVQGMYQPPVDAMGRPMGWPLAPQEMPGLMNCGNYPGWNGYAAFAGQPHVSFLL